REMALLEPEAGEVKPKTEPIFPEGTFEILQHVWEQNRVGKRPFVSDVWKVFGVSRPTATKRIKALKGMGVIMDTKVGRSRRLEVTENGKLYFK
ncbi:MAG: helix-turn-helix domain-containing protein, partial [Candidatus Hydrothermarchaeales archaeon]